MRRRDADPLSPIRRGFALCVALLLTIPAAKAVLADSIDPDFFWHVRVADQLLANGIGPVPDPFSFMSLPRDWSPFSWLGELAMKLIADTGGLPGIVAAHALCSVAFFGLIAWTTLGATRDLTGAPRRLATLVATFAALLFALPFLSFRPVTFALALMAGMHAILWRDRGARDRHVAWLVPMTLVLANLHLYVILWLALLGALTVGAALDVWTDPHGRTAGERDWRRPRRLAWLTLACAVAACGTPMLPGCIRNAIWFQRADPMVAHALVAEITPFYRGPLGAVLAATLVATLALAVRRRRTLGWEHLFGLAAAVVFLFQMGRFASVYAIVATPLLAVVLPPLRDVVLGRPIVRWAVAGTLAVVAGKTLVSFPRPGTTMDAWLTRTGEDDGLKYPTAAAAYVEANVTPTHGRVINELTWGGYLIWRLGDRYQVFMDGRTLIYSADYWERLYLQGEAGRRAVLRDARADAAILPAGRSLLRDALLSLGWTPGYADSRAVVLLPPATTTPGASSVTRVE